MPEQANIKNPPAPESCVPSRSFLSQTTWKPRNSMLLLVPTVEPEKTDGGIYIPDAVRRKVQSGFIADKGPTADTDLSIGDEVFFEQHQEYRIVLDDIKEEAVLIADSHVLLHRPYIQPNVTSQEPLTVNIAAYFELDITQMAGESVTDYNYRMEQQAPEGYYWASLSSDYKPITDAVDGLKPLAS